MSDLSFLPAWWKSTVLLAASHQKAITRMRASLSPWHATAPKRRQATPGQAWFAPPSRDGAGGVLDLRMPAEQHSYWPGPWPRRLVLPGFLLLQASLSFTA